VVTKGRARRKEKSLDQGKRVNKRDKGKDRKGVSMKKGKNWNPEYKKGGARGMISMVSRTETSRSQASRGEGGKGGAFLIFGKELLGWGGKK